MASQSWKENPFSLVGKRVDLEWKQGNRHRGTVTRYNPHFLLHTVHYDDGELKEYDMYTRRFWIIGENPEGYWPSPRGTGPASAGTSGSASTGVNNATGSNNPIYAPPVYGSGYYPATYTYQWTPYVSRTPNASGLATFHLLLDSKMIGTVDAIRINGNLPVMSAWGDGVEMIMETGNPLLWTITLDLPFTSADFCVHGMFQFHYEIVSGGSVAVEGQGEKVEQRLKQHYFHTFRTNYKLPRFRNCTTLSPKLSFQSFVRNEISLIKERKVTIPNAMARFSDIFDSCTGAVRVHMEELFEDEIDVVEAAGQDMDQHLILYFLAGIGKFGLTSSEKVYATGYTYGVYAYGGVDGSSVVSRTPPKPTQWVDFCVDHLDVTGLYGQNWQTVLGTKYYFSVVGIVEAIERLSEHGYYSWLRIIPLTSKHGSRPRISKKTQGKKVESFVEIARLICTMIQDQYALIAAAKSDALPLAVTPATSLPPLPPSATAGAAGDTGVDGSSTALVDSGENDIIGLANLADEQSAVWYTPQKLAEKWLEALISHAPNLSELSVLVDSSLFAFSEFVINPLAKRLEDESFREEADFRILEQIVRKIPNAAGPKMASAMFSNDSTGSFRRNVLSFVQLCSDREGFVSAQSQSTSQETATEGAAGTEQLESLSGDWLALNTAAKDWIRRNHSNEPSSITDVAAEAETPLSFASSWMSIGFGSKESSKSKKKELTEAELRTIRRDSMQNALYDIDTILKLPIFERFPQGILFEFSRCWFLNGSIQSVLETIFSLGNGPRAFHLFSDVLGKYLESKVVKVIRDSMQFKQHTLTIARLANQLLSRNSQLLLTVMLHLIMFTVSPHLIHKDDLLSADVLADCRAPSLKTVLENAELWSVFVNCDSEVLDGNFVSIVTSAKSVLTSVMESVCNDSVTVENLNLIASHIDTFLDLLTNFQCENIGLNRGLVEIRLAALQRFDRLMEEVQTYASFFCSCGVRIESAGIRSTIESIRVRYNQLPSRELNHAFSDVLALSQVSWLYELRSSELFFQLWRNVGKEVCIAQVAELNGTSGGGEADFSGLLALFGGGAGEADEDAALAVDPALSEEARAQAAAELFHQRDRRNFLKTQIEDVVLDQLVVVTRLIPQARAQWADLSRQVFSGEINIQRLETVFKTIQTDSQLREELKLMASTGNTQALQELGSRKTVVMATFERIKDFMLLRQLCKWLPAIIQVHCLVSELCTTAVAEDEFHKLLESSIANIQAGWDGQCLLTIPGLVGEIKGVFSKLSIDQLDFISALSSSPDLVKWLLARNSTEEFNRLLQVVRPCTDEPRLLSAIASLVHIRTLLLQSLYTLPPYLDLQGFLESFQSLDLSPAASSGTSSQAGDSALWHLNNVISSFDALMDIFEKQTRSPGIKSCFDLREIRERGTFVLHSSSSLSSVLTVELASPAGSEEDQTTVETLEYLLDLRSKLLMTEVPIELEEEMQASAMVEAFVVQLQVLSEMSDVLVNLNISGHVAYQDNFELRVRFTLDGLPALQAQFAALQVESQRWSREVKQNRSQYYYLNYFTMREILQMRMWTELLKSGVPEVEEEVAAVAVERVQSPPQIRQAEQDSAEEIYINEMEQMGFSRETAIVALHKSQFDLERAIEYCFSKGQQLDRIVAEELPLILAMTQSLSSQARPDPVIHRSEAKKNPVTEVLNFLHQISLFVDQELAVSLMTAWNELLDTAAQDSSGGYVPILSTFGTVLDRFFSKSEQKIRQLTPLGSTVANRGDLLYVLNDDSEKRLPVFVTSTDDPTQVIDTVLSIYIRRSRLPEPGEVLFCTTETTAEELNIFLLRFVRARDNNLPNSIFCIADLHNLSYTQQCNLVELLRGVIQDHGQDSASTLVIVSGHSRQMALNALSSQHVDLPPLATKHLRTACEEAFRIHCGETSCISSTINGGGKTHHILSTISKRQMSESVVYVKVPIRESTASRKLIDLLSAVTPGPGEKIAFHLDIAHIIPAAANTMLFQLLIVGVLRDPVSCRVFFRRPEDFIFVEMPNSLHNKTAIALRLCTVLPTRVLSVNADTIQLVRPVFVDSRICVPEYTELINVCKWLRAIKMKKLKRGTPHYAPEFSPEYDAAITSAECFDLLRESCCAESGPSPQPSWSLFRSFVVFLNMQFSMLGSYGLMNSGILDTMEGLENFRTVFVHLLVETSKDFALRSVAQVANVGPQADADDATGSKVSAKEAVAAKDEDSSDDEAPPPPPRRLTRQTSSELRDALQQADADAPPALVRQTSEEMVSRFQTMISWEQSDHPIVSFKIDGYGGVDGVDILSLNPEYVNRYINGNLKANLEATGFNFSRDWDKITNEEGVEILRQVEGLKGHQRGGAELLEKGYVMTIDNVLKMLSIQLRLRFDVPVIIMGETGCGKSTLIRNMCIILGVPLHTLNVHGGIEDHDIITWMNERIKICEQMRDRDKYLVVFLDEINTCNCMGLFKEIVCDRTMNGSPLPTRIKIIAACNPYRLRSTTSLYGGEEMAGLAFETFNSSTHLEGVGTGIKDPLRNLVYRVHPLPESMIDFVYDFGSLSGHTESLYIKAMLRRQLGRFNETDALIDEIVAAESSEAAGRRGHQAAAAAPRFVPLSPFAEFVEVFSELVCAAQECIRSLSGGERSSASLRDVSRCVKVFIWFGNHFANTCGISEGWELSDFFRIIPKTQKYVRKAVVLSLAYCYHARLPRKERKDMVEAIVGAWRKLQHVPLPTYNAYNGGLGGVYGIYDRGLQQQLQYQMMQADRKRHRCTWLNLDVNAFHGILEDVQREFVSKFALGDGIALNEAILENLFMILVSVLNQIPIFVIGKPGSSKSLAMGLIQSNLNGDASDNEFLKSMPAVEVFSYQCSPLSTSAGIEQAFESSRRYRREAQNTVVVVLLDEVGLAEQSPHLPLKVLHKMFDEAGEGEGVVGISNWALDPAKMNRAVHLYRPAPSVDDLSLTAEGMVRSANLKGYLRALARAYNSTYQEQEHPDFWGLREFYSTVRAINSSLSRVRSETGNEAAVLDSDMLLYAVLRNFGGRPHEMERITDCFFGEIGLPIPRHWKNIAVESLILQNLSEPDARHLMLLTRNNAALSLLLDRSILKQDNIEIIFGSDFPLDQNDLQVCLNIQRVKLCMAEGITVVLVHCESLYESLYDLLNQHYVEYGGQTYVRLAFGTYTRLCPIHKSFRVVVIVETIDAYTRLAPPLLNRFEKQVFERKDTLRPAQLSLLSRLTAFASAFANVSGNEASDQTANSSTLRKAFCGYHSDMLSSLVLATCTIFDRHNAEKSGATTATESGDYSDQHLEARVEDALFHECARRLLWVAAPEATCRLLGLNRGDRDRYIKREYDVDCGSIYFKDQRHSSLSSFVEQVGSLGDELGIQAVVMTYSPLSQDAVESFNTSTEQGDGLKVSHIVLHELDQERTLRQSVTEFFKNATSGSTLLVQCDPLATSKRRIEHTKFIIESARSKYLKTFKETLRQNIAASGLDEGASESKSGDDDSRHHVSDEQAHLDSIADGEGAMEPVTVVETESQTRLEWKGVHVVLLLHLPRSETEGDQRYCVDFDTRWRFAFVDSIVSADSIGLPDVEMMIGKNVIDVIKIIDMKKALIKSFRSSLAKLIFSNERTNEDVRRQIVTILKCFEDASFVDLLRSLTQSVLSAIQSNSINKSKFEMGSEATEDHLLLLTGTFQGALHMQILEQIADCFAVILSHMDRNGCLTLLLDGEYGKMWRYLFQASFNPSNAAIKLTKRASPPGGNKIQSKNKDIPVTCDGFDNQTFESKFPFSFYLSALVDSMRKKNESSDELQLVRQLSTLNLENDIGSILPANQIRSYLHDIVAMKCRKIVDVSREEQTDLVNRILEMVPLSSSSSETSGHFASGHDVDSSGLEGVEDITVSSDSSSSHSDGQHSRALNSIAVLHHRFWKVERILDLYFEILNALPICVAKIIQFFGNKHSEGDLVGPNLHSEFLNIILQSLEVSGEFWREEIVTETETSKFDAWLMYWDSSRPHITALVDLIEDPGLKHSILMRMNRLGFFKAFVQNVCIPLSVDFDKARDMLVLFTEANMCTNYSLIVTLSQLSKLNLEILREEIGNHDDFMCPITLIRIVEPVIAADGHTYEKSAILQWFSSGRSTSPKTNLPLANTSLRPNLELKERLSKLLECDLSHFLEYFIFEVVFRGIVDLGLELSLELIQSLVSLSAGILPEEANDSRFAQISVLPSSAARTGILRELFRLFTSRAFPSELLFQFKETLSGCISALARTKSYLDHPLAVAYCTVREELFSRGVELDHFQFTESEIRFDLDPMGSEIFQTLSSIAYLRSKVTQFSEVLCNPVRTDVGLVEVESSLLSKFFVDYCGFGPSSVDSPLCHRIKMFLFKQIERRKGVSFLRSSLLETPLNAAPWVVDWKMSGDVIFSRFLGSNKIPKVNPLAAFPLFPECQEILSQYLVTGSIALVESSLGSLVGNHDKKTVQGAFLLASFHEIFLLSVLPLESTLGLEQKRIDFDAWLRSSSLLRSVYDRAEFQLFLTFASPNRSITATSPVLAFFELSPDCSVESILRARVAAHLTAVALSSPDSHPFAFFKTLMTRPQHSVGTFYPTMHEDVLKMAQDAMGGRWYKCPNQHPYYVDLCGRPTVIQHCSECGAQIGGLEHNLLTDNIDIGNVGTAYYQTTVLEDNTDRNYCLRDAQLESEDKFYSVRVLDPRAVRAIRILMHISLLVGYKSLGESWLREVDGIFNHSYCNPGRDAPNFIFEHLTSDWNLLSTMLTKASDDVALLFHIFVLNRSGSFVPESSGGAYDFSNLATCPARTAWEAWFFKEFSLYSNADTLNNALKSAETRFGQGEEESGGAFISELLERTDVNSLTALERRSSVPALFTFTRSFNFSHFQFTLSMIRGVKDKFPLLLHFIEQEHILKALKFLPKLFEWFRLLRSKYNGHLDRETARTKTIHDVIHEVDEADRPRWVTAFQDFANCWNTSWPSVQKFGCLTFSSDYNSLRMDESASVCFSLPNDTDEGLCPLALTQFLTTKHNELVQLVDEALLLRVKRTRQESTRAKAISSRFLTSAHCFNYRLSDFVSFLEKQCITTDSVGYDFSKAENKLIDQYLSQLPAVDLEQSGFVYAHEQQGSLSILRQKLKQEPIPPEFIETIRRDFINPAAAQRVLENLEIVVDFLVSTGGSVIQTLDTSLGEMLLSKYMKTVLMVDDEIESRILSQQIRLKHLDSLWGILGELTSTDVFANVHFEYRKPLTPKSEQALKDLVKTDFELDKFLGYFKQFILEHLSENNIKVSSPLVASLNFVEAGDQYLVDCGWFASNFPASLLLGEALEAFKFLQQINQI